MSKADQERGIFGGKKKCPNCDRITSWAGIEPSSCPACNADFNPVTLGRDTAVDGVVDVLETAPVKNSLALLFWIGGMGIGLVAFVSGLSMKHGFAIGAGVLIGTLSFVMLVLNLRSSAASKRYRQFDIDHVD